jgi:dihydroorotate dehydrogenase electron transfer subunit
VIHAGPCEVTAADAFGAYRVLWFRAPGVAARVEPGQFVTIAGQPGGACLLRRPFSVYQTNGEDVSVVFDAVGTATRWLASRTAGDVIDIVGPLGHGFDLPDGPGADLLVGGGYGGAAMSLLAQRLRARGATPRAILGARSAERIFEDAVIREACETVVVTTDDGSAGARGLVIDAMPALLDGARAVYACGPMRMLEAVADAAETAGVASQLAVEEFMACGVGVCWTCVLPVRDGADVKHARSCTEGPVFAGTAVAWA